MLTENQRELLGARLVELRQKSGMSAVQVAAEALGYANGSHVAVTRLERVVHKAPNPQHLLKLARFYGVEPSHLFAEGVEEGTAEPAAEQPPAAPKPGMARKPVSARVPRTLTQRIAHIREEAGLDEAGLASALRGHGALIMRSDVEAWESEQRTPNPIQLRALSKFAELSEEWLLGGAGSRAEAAPQGFAPWVPAGAAS